MAALALQYVIIMTVITRVWAEDFWLYFDDRALGVGLYMSPATQPYFNIFAQIVKPMNASQDCRWQFSHKETL